MNINWYPGHMKKTIESIESKLKMVDMVIELVDARAPISSKNPMLDSILKSKDRIIVLTKKDLADESKSQTFLEKLKGENDHTILLDATNRKDVDRLFKLAENVVRDRRKNDKEKGIINRPVRAMIVGIPNVGKSTLINTLSGRKGAKVGNKPGVTKSNQWIKTTYNLELLDTPGVLWPKFEDKNIALNLAFIGSITDNVLDRETLALRLIERLQNIYPNLLDKRYNINSDELTGLEAMEKIASKRGCIISGGEVDYTRVSNLILDEFRKGIIGKISLE